MGWGCYKHEIDAGSDTWERKMDSLAEKKLEPGDRKSWGRDGEICPFCWEEMEIEHARYKKALEVLAGAPHVWERSVAQDALGMTKQKGETP